MAMGVAWESDNTAPYDPLLSKRDPERDTIQRLAKGEARFAVPARRRAAVLEKRRTPAHSMLLIVVYNLKDDGKPGCHVNGVCAAEEDELAIIGTDEHPLCDGRPLVQRAGRRV